MLEHICTHQVSDGEHHPSYAAVGLLSLWACACGMLHVD